MIRFYNPWTSEDIGRWTLDGDTITADARTQDILDAALRTGSAQDAWRRYSSWSNGYVSSELIPDDTGVSEFRRLDPALATDFDVVDPPADPWEVLVLAWTDPESVNFEVHDDDDDLFAPEPDDETKDDPRDADNDGWIYEGTPKRRPAVKKPRADRKVYRTAVNITPQPAGGHQPQDPGHRGCLGG